MATDGNPPNNGWQVTICLKSGHTLNVVLKELNYTTNDEGEIVTVSWENQANDRPGLKFICPRQIEAIVSQEYHSFELAPKSGFEDL